MSCWYMEVLHKILSCYISVQYIWTLHVYLYLLWMQVGKQTLQNIPLFRKTKNYPEPYSTIQWCPTIKMIKKITRNKHFTMYVYSVHVQSCRSIKNTILYIYRIAISRCESSNLTSSPHWKPFNIYTYHTYRTTIKIIRDTTNQNR